jgi:hypothetical protein
MSHAEFKVTPRRARKVNAMSFAHLMRLLMEGTRTSRELAAETGLHPLTVYDYTAYLRKYHVVHICTWEGEGRSAQRVFMLGDLPDAPRPKKSRKQIHDEYRARKSMQNVLKRMAGTTDENRRDQQDTDTVAEQA